MPSNHYSLASTSFLSSTINNREEQQKQVENDEAENYSMISNENVSSMTYKNKLPMCTRILQEHQQQQQQQHQPSLVLVAEENEIFDTDNNKLLLPCSTRSLRRRTSFFDKGRDWARRFMTLHRDRRNTTSNEKIRETCSQLNKTKSHHEFLHNHLKSFDEDGYLSPMEIKAKLDNISRENHLFHHQSLSKLSTNARQQLIVYSHSSSDISHPVYRCHGPIMRSSTPQCTCHHHQQQQQQHPQQQQHLSTKSFISEFDKSLSIVDYIDFDVSEESSSSASFTSKQNDADDDPLDDLRYLFDDNNNNNNNKQQNGSFIRRTPRRSTNTSSISADSGYCDIPMSSSKFIPVHLISCTLIPVNVTRTDSMDIRCLTCTCPSVPATYFSNKTERRRRKSSAHSSGSQFQGTYSRQHLDIIENEINNHCSCNNKYYSTMTICPTLSLSSPMETKSITKIDVNYKNDYYNKQQHKKYLRKKRTNLSKLSTTADDLTSVIRWYRPNLSRDAMYHVLQQADYGAFILRKSTTHPDCYALSVKVPKFAHESSIVHYLIEKITNQQNIASYRIKGTIKQFPTLLSLLTHHSVMPEILPITLNLNEISSV
ncbi:unnamed protein product [Adineta steineri]|uniref:SH2 domain-containing protein n=1 Tax=Adineta steineri TaxID=433720 RepID=A0A813RDK0_9BILA|nr:unnamed protein product [Adineta steineri]